MNKKLFLALGLQFAIIFLLSSAILSLSSDMIENLLWGRKFDFSSDKHPPLFGWESYFIVSNFGMWAYHLLTPFHILIMMFFTYLLAKKVLKKEVLAILAVILSQGIIVHVFYYKFNANTANYGLFSIIYYLFYLCIKNKKYALFLPISALCAFTFLIKYSAVILIGLLWLTLFITKEGKKALKTFYPYLGALVFMLILSPYILYLARAGEDGAINYLMEQSINIKTRWYELPRFLIMPVVFCLPMLFAFFAAKPKLKKYKQNFEGTFLLVNTLGPFVFVFFYILITLSQVGVYWLSMFFCLIPVCLLYFFEVNKNALSLAFKIIYPILGVGFFIYFIIALFNSEDDNKAIAEFTKEVQGQEDITNFACNDARRICGIVLIYGTKYSKVQMPLFKGKSAFAVYNGMEQKPKKIIIIGEDEALQNLKGYTFTRYEKVFPKYYKFRFVEKAAASAPKFLQKILAKLSKPIKITLTIAVLKNERNSKEKKLLAKAHKIIAHNKWDDLTYTHLSIILEGRREFLLSPFGIQFANIKVKDIIKFGIDGRLFCKRNLFGSKKPLFNKTGFAIHSSIYKARKDVGAVIHLHTKETIAVASSKAGLLPVSQHALHFYGRVSYHSYNSLILTPQEEEEMLIKDLAQNNVMLLENHGFIAVGKTIWEALFYVHHLQRACEVQVLLKGDYILPNEETCLKARDDLLTFEKDLGKRDFESYKF